MDSFHHMCIRNENLKYSTNWSEYQEYIINMIGNCFENSLDITNIEFVQKLSFDTGNALVFLGFHPEYGLCVVKDHLFSTSKIPFHIVKEIDTIIQIKQKQSNKSFFQQCLNISVQTSHVRIVFEYLPKCLNSDLNISTRFLRHIIKGIITTVSELHRLGISHRDIKVDNLCLRLSCDIVIIDMDSAGNIDNNGHIIPITTIDTRAPEIFTFEIEKQEDKRKSCIYSNEKLDAWGVAITILQLTIDETVFDNADRVNPTQMLEAIERLINEVAVKSERMVKAKERMGSLWGNVFIPLLKTDPLLRSSVLEVEKKLHI